MVIILRRIVRSAGLSTIAGCIMLATATTVHANLTDTWVLQSSQGTTCNVEVSSDLFGIASAYGECDGVPFEASRTGGKGGELVEYFSKSCLALAHDTGQSAFQATLYFDVSADMRSATFSIDCLNLVNVLDSVVATGTATRLCNNGVADPGEDCADGNFENGDCCDSHCRLELGCQCSDLAPFADDDGDGVPNYGDDCSDTVASYGVDSHGCSLEQFCGRQDVSTMAGRADCRRLDWLNDEPRMKRGEKDCTYDSLSHSCIPAFEAPCADGYSDCDGDPLNGCETHTEADVANCGFCGVPCASGPHSTAFCNAGTCTLPCDPGFTDCDGNASNGCESDLQNDEQTCGTCSIACAAGIACDHGQCGCRAGYGDCNADVSDGCESNTSDDVANCGTCGNACAAGEECFASACEPPCRGFNDCRRVFLSSQIVNGNVGGLAGADSLCQTLARNAHLNGTYMAWLSDSTTSASERLEHSVVPYIRLDGAKVANNWDDLTNGDIRTPINVTEKGEVLSGSNVAVGTNTSARGYSLAEDEIYTCSDWTSSLADEYAFGGAVNNWVNPAHWTAFTSMPFSCAGHAHGYCIEQCAAPHVDCDGNVFNGCEVNLNTDPNHCGSCANTCPPGGAQQTAVCDNGSCGVECVAGYTDCNGNAADGCEVHTATDTANCGTCGHACGVDQTCENGACFAGCGGYSDCRRMFLTSATFTGDTGGLAGTDALCQSAADAAGLRGTYKAWLSSSTVSAASRLEHAAVPYVRPDGAALALDWADLTDGTLAATPNVDENAVAVGGSVVGVFTNTTEAGQIAFNLAAQACNDWTSSSSSETGSGSVAATTTSWSNLTSVGCDFSAHRYCVGQCGLGRLDCDGDAGNGCEVDGDTDPNHCGTCGTVCGASLACIGGQCETPAASKYVFATSTDYQANLGGLAGADALCNQRAAAAGLPGSYAAWLSDDNVSAAARLTHSTDPYVRPDHIAVADDWADLTDGSLDNPINRDEFGNQVSGAAWTGTHADGSGVASVNCENWSTMQETVLGYYGDVASTSSTWSESTPWWCLFPQRLYCLQQ